ncbi:hypothetical protein C8R46DRAFT_1346123 [Mycena filopes]|nr:hypothetical protein C8R46DRAFT_1346123 [Mycena filopes]
MIFILPLLAILLAFNILAPALTFAPPNHAPAVASSMPKTIDTVLLVVDAASGSLPGELAVGSDSSLEDVCLAEFWRHARVLAVVLVLVLAITAGFHRRRMRKGTPLLPSSFHQVSAAAQQNIHNLAQRHLLGPVDPFNLKIHPGPVLSAHTFTPAATPTDPAPPSTFQVGAPLPQSGGRAINLARSYQES